MKNLSSTELGLISGGSIDFNSEISSGMHHPEPKIYKDDNGNTIYCYPKNGGCTIDSFGPYICYPPLPEGLKLPLEIKLF